MRAFGSDPGPNVSLSAYEGLVSSSLNASGSGFVNNSTLTLTFGSKTISQCLSGNLTPNETGNFSCVFRVPALPAPGPYLVNATNGTTPDTAVANFTIDPPTLSLSPTHGRVGSLVHATGAGYNGSTKLALTLGSTDLSCVAGSATTTIDGTLSCTFHVPPLTAQTTAYLVVASDGVNSQSAPYTIDPPTLSAVPTEGNIGSSVTASGAGYDPGVKLTLLFGPVDISACSSGSLTPNGTGIFAGCSFLVPTVREGLTELSASDGVNTAYANYTVANSTLLLTPDEGNVSETVAATGTGFATDTILTLTFSGAEISSCVSGSLKTTSSGDLDCSFTVPAATAGANQVVASDGTNPAFANFTVEPQLTLSPSTGEVGTAVTATGTGFDASSPYSVTWNSTVTLCSGTTDPSGGFSCFLAPIPAASEGGHTLTATEGSNTAGAAFAVTPGLALSPSAGIAGTIVDLEGTGLAAVTQYTYCFLATVTHCSAGNPTFTTDADGSVPSAVNLSVPAEAPGTYFVDVSLLSAVVANASFTLTSASLLLSPVSGPVGTDVTLSGSGYEPDSSYTVCFQTSSVACSTGILFSFTSTSGGDVPSGVSFTVAEEPAGVYYVDVSVGASFVAAGEFTLQSSLTIVPADGIVGATVAAEGTGFDATAAFSVLWNSSATVCTGTTDAAGDLACSFVVPFAPGGSHTVTAQQGSLNVATGFLVLSSLVVAPTEGAVASSATVTGTGFLASSSGVSVTWNAVTSLCTASTNATGAFSCGFSVPTAPAGPNNVSASQGVDSASTSFRVVPSLTLSSSSGVVGASVTLVGTGFDGSTSYLVKWGSSVTLCSGTTSATGGLDCLFVVPPAPEGPVTITVDEGTYSPTVTFTVGAGFSLTPDSGVVGSVATVTGAGFSPNAAFTVYWDSGATLCAGSTTSAGGVSCNFTIPSTPGGTHTVSVAVGSVNATATFSVTPDLLLSLASDTVGSTVTATGTGFSVSAPYTVSWNASATLCSGTTSSAGWFSCTFAVPMAPGGAGTLTALGGTLSTTASLTITASLAVSPSSGPVGTTVTATGRGFAADASYSVNWNSSTVLCAGKTNSNGGFACTFAIPASSPGAYSITAGTAAGAPSGQFTVSTSGITPPATTSPLLSWWQIAAIAVAFILAFLLAALMFRRRSGARRPRGVNAWEGAATGAAQTSVGSPPGAGATVIPAGAGTAAPATPGATAAAGASNPSQDIDVLMARLEQMSIDLYQSTPEQLSAEPSEAAEAGKPEPKAPKPDAEKTP